MEGQVVGEEDCFEELLISKCVRQFNSVGRAGYAKVVESTREQECACFTFHSTFQFWEEISGGKPPEEEVRNEECVAFVPVKVLEVLGTLPGSLVELKSKHINRVSYVRLFLINNDSFLFSENVFPDYFILLRPIEWFNAHRSPEMFCVPFVNSICGQITKVKRLDSVECPLVVLRRANRIKTFELPENKRSAQTIDESSAIVPKASRLHIGLIRTPNAVAYTFSQYSMDECIKQYFTTERIVQEGDVVCVPILGDKLHKVDVQATEMFSGIGLLHARREFLFFKVLKLFAEEELIEATALKVCLPYCEIYQEEGVNSQIPASFSDMPNFASLYSMHSIYHDKADELLKILRPYFLHSNGILLKNGISMLLHGESSCGKKTLAFAVCKYLGFHLVDINLNIIAHDSQSTEGLTRRLDKISMLIRKSLPAVVQLKGLDSLPRVNRMSKKQSSSLLALIKKYVQQWMRLSDAHCKESKEWCIVFGIASGKGDIEPSLSEIFRHDYEVTLSSTDVELVLTSLLKGTNLKDDVCIKEMVAWNKFASLSGLRQFVNFAVMRCGMGGSSLLGKEDFKASLNNCKKQDDSLKNIPTIPEVTWEDIGGLDNVKKEIREMIELPFKYPELLGGKVMRSGILLYGPPGTGKTLLAKAVATECGLKFMSVNGPELLNMYVGQSEANIRDTFEKARKFAPCVLFFDELDSLAPKRGNLGDSGGVMDRIVSQLLSELDQVSSRDAPSSVFVIGATNRPDLLDQALIRPGRFDKMVYVGVDMGDQSHGLFVLKALTRKLKLALDVNLEDVLRLCEPNFTGADYYALCSTAMLAAVNRTLKNEMFGDSEHGKKVCPIVEVKFEDFCLASKQVTSSVSQEELLRFESIKKDFS
eukprot:Nk52_evm26s2192 gene=Nk52_evmTU26s2192